MDLFFLLESEGQLWASQKLGKSPVEGIERGGMPGVTTSRDKLRKSTLKNGRCKGCAGLGQGPQASPGGQGGCHHPGWDQHWHDQWDRDLFVTPK